MLAVSYCCCCVGIGNRSWVVLLLKKYERCWLWLKIWFLCFHNQECDLITITICITFGYEAGNILCVTTRKFYYDWLWFFIMKIFITWCCIPSTFVLSTSSMSCPTSRPPASYAAPCSCKNFNFFGFFKDFLQFQFEIILTDNFYLNDVT